MTTSRAFVAISAAMLMAGFSSAGPFRFRRTPNNGGPVQQPAPVVAYTADFTSTCAGVAQRMAELGRIRHFGNPGPWPFEGVGMGPTRESAIANCCYYGRRPLMESAAVQGRNGYWFACNRYR